MVISFGKGTMSDSSNSYSMFSSLGGCWREIGSSVAIEKLLGEVSSSCTVVSFSLSPWISWGSSKSSDRVYGNRVVFLSTAAKADSVVAFVSSQSPDRMSASERMRPGLVIGLGGNSKEKFRPAFLLEKVQNFVV